MALAVNSIAASGCHQRNHSTVATSTGAIARMNTNCRNRRTHLNRETLLPDQVEQSSCLLDIAISREGIIIPYYPGVRHWNCLPDIAISREGIIIPDYPGVRHSKCLPDIAISREGIIIPDYPVVWPDFLI